MITREKNLVSIIITSFNREKYIKDCLESILAQTYRDIEIILVDDCSTDNTLQIFNEFKREAVEKRPEMKDRIISISLPRNVGYAGPLTLGMFLSKGEFIAIQDSDDISHSERIEKQVSYLIANPQYELVGTLFSSFFDYKNGKLIGLRRPVRWIKFNEEIYKVYKRGGHCICHGTTLFRGSVFDRLGGFTRRLGKEADFEFLQKCIKNGVKANNLPEVLYYYRRHPEQMSKKDDTGGPKI
ncbi:glycosyltransferase family 2 protein [Neobacillus niacini]|uniref:glycosyltransferase family 2 protein n=1 Tax=Neobacillus niacini TaxID=86668 RepID=UPI003B018FF2